MSALRAGSGSTDHIFPWKWRLSDLPKENNGKTVFSCFSCGGGSTMGYKLAGYKMLGCCEIDPAMMEVYKANHHPKHSFCEDIRDLVEREDLPEELYALDVLDGSPPCSVFSLAGKRDEGWNVEKKFREGQKMQRLDDLFFHFIRLADKLKPKVVVAENVKGMIVGNARGWVNQIIKAYGEAGYDVQVFLLNSAKMGVPQKRERVFFLARRKDLNLPPISLVFNQEPIPFGDVRSKNGKEYTSEDSASAILLSLRTPKDRCVADISVRTRRKMSGFSAPINWDDEPVQTITAGGSLYRGCDGKPMTDEDIRNCQTFPQDYDFHGQKVQYVCGMSVPPVMMANLSREVYRQWLT